MKPHGVQSGVEQKDFGVRTGRGIGSEDGGDIFAG
jgi:hypothetical protein